MKYAIAQAEIFLPTMSSIMTQEDRLIGDVCATQWQVCNGTGKGGAFKEIVFFYCNDTTIHYYTGAHRKKKSKLCITMRGCLCAGNNNSFCCALQNIPLNR